MSEDNFVSRWSRLKREAAQRRKVPSEAEAQDAGPDGAAFVERRSEGSSEATKEEPEIDLASLPSIESIVAGTDIRAFLQKGVPAELTKAALRRAWVADPAIRDFIEIAENQWDFTDPTSIPGFGALQPTDNVGHLVTQAMGKLSELPDDVAAAHGPPPAAVAKKPDAKPLPPSESTGDKQDAGDGHGNVAELSQPEPVLERERVRVRKGHGRALPR